MNHSAAKLAKALNEVFWSSFLIETSFDEDEEVLTLEEYLAPLEPEYRKAA